MYNQQCNPDVCLGGRLRGHDELENSLKRQVGNLGWQNFMTTNLGTLNYGKSYLRAAEHLVSEIQAARLSLPFHDPISLLLGHSIELVLKSCLLTLGATEKEVWGHELVQLRASAIKHGCKLALNSIEEEHLGLLNNAFGKAPFTVRYLQTGFTTVHDDTIIIALAQRFVDEAEILVSSASPQPQFKMEPLP